MIYKFKDELLSKNLHQKRKNIRIRFMVNISLPTQMDPDESKNIDIKKLLQILKQFLTTIVTNN